MAGLYGYAPAFLPPTDKAGNWVIFSRNSKLFSNSLDIP
jgi:hypothetical protein